MVNVYDWYIIGSLAFTLSCWWLCVWLDKDNNKGNKK